MKIIKEYNWSRRDFVYDAKCEGCGEVKNGNSGYDDYYFRNTVVPAALCSKCGASSNSLGVATKSETKHNPNITL